MKTGPITRSELIALWRSGVDPNFGRRFVEAGEGGGFEVYTQAFRQFEEVSEAIDTTTQSMYLLPHSSQTSEPAGGARRARVTLTISRVGDATRCYILRAGQTVFEETTTDYGENGPQTVKTGRRYVALETVAMAAGSLGPISVECEAIRAGYSGNRAQEGNINRFRQPGAGYSNVDAELVPGLAGHRLVASPVPDVPLPDHVGQYVVMVAGANAGQVRRVVGYEEPVTDSFAPTGGTLILAPTGQWQVSGAVGTFETGEQVESSSGGKGVVWFASSQRIVIDRTDGVFAVADTVTGVRSAATVTLAAEEISPDMAAESAAAWRVVDWHDEALFTVTNVARPSGGRSGMLDTLGRERLISRSSGEDDESYRKRVATVADVVSPNAVRRAGNRVLAPLGASIFLREVGLATLPGLYFEGDAGSIDPAVSYAYDMDFASRPEDRFKLAFDYTEFRAFMLIGVPDIGLGDFGCAYDAGFSNAYDAAPFYAFADGFPVTAAIYYRAVWQAVDGVRGGGVGFDLYKETG